MRPMDKEYVRGFFDRLCSIDASTRAIVLTTDRVDLGRRVAAKVRAERIECSMRVHEGRIKLRISTRDSLERWRKVFGFLDPAKARRLDDVLNSYRRASDEQSRGVEEETPTVPT